MYIQPKPKKTADEKTALSAKRTLSRQEIDAAKAARSTEKKTTGKTYRDNEPAIRQAAKKSVEPQKAIRATDKSNLAAAKKAPKDGIRGVKSADRVASIKAERAKLTANKRSAISETRKAAISSPLTSAKKAAAAKFKTAKTTSIAKRKA